MEQLRREIAFIVPFRPLNGFVAAKEVLALLSTTIGSVRRQTDPNWRLILSTSDLLKIPVDDRRIEQLVPTGALSCASNDPSIGYSDMHLKRKYAAKHAFDTGSTHIMFLDADDLVHKDLAKHVNNGNKETSYLAETGYELLGETLRVMLRLSKFAARCGSTAIVSENDFRTDFFKGNTDCDTSPYYHHNYVSYLFHKKAEFLPAPMVIYRTEHVGNITKGVKDLTKRKDWVRDIPRLIRLIGKFAFSRAYDSEFSDQFGNAQEPALILQMQKQHHQPKQSN